jgi:hypothetical protein
VFLNLKSYIHMRHAVVLSRESCVHNANLHATHNADMPELNCHAHQALKCSCMCRILVKLKCLVSVHFEAYSKPLLYVDYREQHLQPISIQVLSRNPTQ